MDSRPITVRMFAALRDAAGVTSVTVQAPTTVADIIASLSQRFGTRFAERLAVAKVMVDGEITDPDSTTPVASGAEVALLPPFAGG